jgi:predicted nucleic acid-binding protein
MNHQYYQPETWAMLKDSIYAAQEALKIGIEYSKELLAEFEFRFGRSTRSNRITAERIEEEIRQMEYALDGILNPNGKTES